MYTVNKISSRATFEVRQPVLRKEKPIESCHFDGDDLPSTQHYGAFENNHLIGVISIFEKKNTLFTDENQRQIRGMAILESYQGKGIGQLLITHCENMLLQDNKPLIWFNARINAVGFYKKMGYKTVGDIFEIEGVGPHYVMFKNL